MDSLLSRKVKELDQQTLKWGGVDYMYNLCQFKVPAPINTCWLPIFTDNQSGPVLCDIWPGLCIQKRDELCSTGCKHEKCHEFHTIYRSYVGFLAHMSAPASQPTKKRKASELSESSSSSEESNDSVITGHRVISQYTREIRDVPIKGCFYVANFYLDMSINRWIVDIHANNFELTRTSTTIELAFYLSSGEEYSVDEEAVTYLCPELSRAQLTLNLKRHRILYHGDAPLILNGHMMSLIVDEIETKTGTHGHQSSLLHIVFKDWKNSTFPLRNDNENEFLLLSKLILHATPITRPWFHEDVTCADSLHMIRVSNLIAEFLGVKNPVFEKAFTEKQDWTDWLKNIDENHYSRNEPKYIELAKIKDKLHCNRGFQVITPMPVANIQYFIDQFRYMYGGKNRLNYEIEVIPNWPLNSDFYLRDHCPIIFSGLPVYGESIFHLQDRVPDIKTELTYVMIKPYGLRRHALEILVKQLCSINVTVKYYRVTPLCPEAIFTALYPNCLSRPYGSEWRSYIMSGPTVHMIVATEESQPTVPTVRMACLNARIDSKYIWTRNIVHSSSSISESEINIETIINFEKNVDSNRATTSREASSR